MEERTRCCENERLDTLLSMGLYRADTYRDVYIASQPRKYAPLWRRCRQPTGHRALKDASDRLHTDDLFNYWPGIVDLSRLDWNDELEWYFEDICSSIRKWSLLANGVS